MLRILLLTLLLCPVGLKAQSPISKNVTLLCNWQDTSVPVGIFNSQFNDVWGLTSKGKEYAVIGSTIGTNIIDVASCQRVAYYPGRASSVLHRDFKTYKNYLYAVADEGVSSLQIFDYSYLPDSLHLVYESDPTELCRSHNIFIDTLRAKLYFAGTATHGGIRDFMRVYSLQKPDSPTLITTYNEYDYVHDVFVRNDTAYCSSSYSGLIINRFNAPNVPYETIGGLLTYPYKGYNHSIWVNEQGIGVMADETPGMPLKVVDFSKISDPRVLSTFSPLGLDTNSCAHNPYLIGNFAYISYYKEGFQLYDLTDPRNPRQVGYYDTYLNQALYPFVGAWGCYPYLPSRKVLISDMQTGLYVLDASAALGLPSISKENSETLLLYPNPATNYITLSLPVTVKGKAVCTVYDEAGRKVANWNVVIPANGNEAISLPLPGSLKPGSYVLRTEAGGRLFNGRFTKL